MNDPLITFGLTVFRRPSYLLQSAGSILAQTYSHLELLIGINPSDSEAPALMRCAEMLAAFDPRVRIVLCPGCESGFAKSLHLLQHGRGTWWAFLDYDDISLPDRLEKQVPFVDRYDVVSGQAIYFGMKDGLRIPVPSGDLSPDDFRSYNPVVSPTVLVKTDLLRRIDPDYARGPYDYKLWVDLINEGRRFHALTDVLALHRLAPDSAYNACMNQELVRAIGRQVRPLEKSEGRGIWSRSITLARSLFSHLSRDR